MQWEKDPCKGFKQLKQLQRNPEKNQELNETENQDL